MPHVYVYIFTAGYNKEYDVKNYMHIINNPTYYHSMHFTFIWISKGQLPTFGTDSMLVLDINCELENLQYGCKPLDTGLLLEHGMNVGWTKKKKNQAAL